MPPEKQSIFILLFQVYDDLKKADMGLFTSLFASKALEQPSGRKELIYLVGAAKSELEITGDEHYQAALEAICGSRVPRGVKLFETASLKLEDKSPRLKMLYVLRFEENRLAI